MTTMAEYAARENAAANFRNGKPKFQRNVTLKKRLPEFVGKGETTRTIAKQLGCSHVAVWKALKREGIKL